MQGKKINERRKKGRNEKWKTSNPGNLFGMWNKNV